MKPELIIMCGELSVPDCREAKGLVPDVGKEGLPAIVLWKNEQEYSDGARGGSVCRYEKTASGKMQPVLAEVRSRVIALLQVLCNEWQIE